MRLVAFIVVLLALVAGFAVTFQRHEGLFAPAFVDGGDGVVYVQRNSTGFVWGLGWEFFTPPAHTWVLDDRVSLRRWDRATRRVRVLRRWPRSPLVGRTIDEYRGRSFAFLNCALRADTSGGVAYSIGLSVPRVPSSEQFRIHGRWPAAGGAADPGWEAGTAMAGVSEPVLSGAEEVMTVPGHESHPAAIVAYDSRSRRARVLIRTGASFDALYRDSLPLAALAALSRRAAIEHLDSLRRTHDDLLARYEAEGLGEGDAALRAIREMERQGWYPRSPFVVARRVGPREAPADSVPRFDISDEEFRVGLFQDLERAIAAPGEEIDFGGHYIVHSDFTTSQRLNAWLERGGRVFRVRRDHGATYEMTVTRVETR